MRWLLQRITGLLLAACLITHTVIIHFSGHSPVDMNVVHDRLKDNFWLIFYAVFLGSTLFHGLNGFYEVIDDYKLPLKRDGKGRVLSDPSSHRLQALLGVVLWGVGLIALAWGVYVLVQWHNLAI